jgi:hypothetical protein
VVRSGGDWDRWDLQVRGGLLGVARLRIGIEEHGAGRQLVRVRSWPYAPRAGVLFGLLGSTLAIIGWIDDKETAATLLGIVSATIVLRLLYECGAACATIAHALRRPAASEQPGLEVTGDREHTEAVSLTLGLEIQREG